MGRQTGRLNRSSDKNKSFVAGTLAHRREFVLLWKGIGDCAYLSVTERKKISMERAEIISRSWPSWRMLPRSLPEDVNENDLDLSSFRERCTSSVREKILCRYQFALQDAVEPALCSAHWRRRFRPHHRTIGYSWCRKSGAFSGAEPEPLPCVSGQRTARYPGGNERLSFQRELWGDTVYFDWYHFSWTATGCRPSSPAFWNSTATCAMARRLQTRPSCAARPMTSGHDGKIPAPQPPRWPVC